MSKPTSAFPEWNYNGLPAPDTLLRSPLRGLIDDYLAWGRSKNTIFLLTSVDVSSFLEIAGARKAARQRPPSLVAYVARCIGASLGGERHLIASRMNGKLYVPHAVNIAMMVSANTPDGDAIPYIMEIERTDTRKLDEIGEEMARRARAMRREKLPQSPMLQGAMKLGALPTGVRRNIYRLAMIHPKFRRYIAHYTSFVGLTAVTDYTGGRSFWGVPIMPYACSVTMGGVSRKPVVVGDAVVPRDCLDLTFCCDHSTLDGAAGSRICDRICTEIESGRLLGELKSES